MSKFVEENVGRERGCGKGREDKSSVSESSPPPWVDSWFVMRSANKEDMTRSQIANFVLMVIFNLRGDHAYRTKVIRMNDHGVYLKCSRSLLLKYCCRHPNCIYIYCPSSLTPMPT